MTLFEQPRSHVPELVDDVERHDDPPYTNESSCVPPRRGRTRDAVQREGGRPLVWARAVGGVFRS